MDQSIGDPANIFVMVNGVVQMPNIDYTVSGNILTFASIPPFNSDIEVRYFGVVTGVVGFQGSSGAVGYMGSRGTSGSDGYTGSLGYTGSQGYLGSQGFVGSAGKDGLGGAAAPSSFQTIVATSVTSYTLNQTVTAAQNIIVAVNGLVQVPGQDYTVSGTQLNFLSVPNDNSDIEILYFDFAGFIGSVGYKGSSGDPGGNTGYTGSSGIDGRAGYTGSAGLSGYVGSAGIAGSSGGVGARSEEHTSELQPH